MDYLRLFQIFITEKRSITYIYNYLISNKVPSLTKYEWTFDSINNALRAVRNPRWRSTHPIFKGAKDER